MNMKILEETIDRIKKEQNELYQKHLAIVKDLQIECIYCKEKNPLRLWHDGVGSTLKCPKCSKRNYGHVNEAFKKLDALMFQETYFLKLYDIYGEQYVPRREQGSVPDYFD